MSHRPSQKTTKIAPSKHPFFGFLLKAFHSAERDGNTSVQKKFACMRLGRFRNNPTALC